MGFPAENLLEQAYRNRIEEVATYLDEMHGTHYLVFNVSDKTYDPAFFSNRVNYLPHLLINSRTNLNTQQRKGEIHGMARYAPSPLHINPHH